MNEQDKPEITLSLQIEKGQEIKLLIRKKVAMSKADFLIEISKSESFGALCAIGMRFENAGLRNDETNELRTALSSRLSEIVKPKKDANENSSCT